MVEGGGANPLNTERDQSMRLPLTLVKSGGVGHETLYNSRVLQKMREPMIVKRHTIIAEIALVTPYLSSCFCRRPKEERCENRR